MDAIEEQSGCRAHLSASAFSFWSKEYACSQSGLYLNGEQEGHDVTPAHHSRGSQGHNDSPGSRDVSILCFLTHVAACVKASLQSSGTQKSAWLILMRVDACFEIRLPLVGSHISIPPSAIIWPSASEPICKVPTRSTACKVRLPGCNRQCQCTMLAGCCAVLSSQDAQGKQTGKSMRKDRALPV